MTWKAYFFNGTLSFGSTGTNGSDTFINIFQRMKNNHVPLRKLLWQKNNLKQNQM